MKKLQSSRLVKTICFILSIFFSAGVAVNIVLGLLLSESNLFYAEKDQLTEMADEEIVEHYNQSDIRYYLQWSVMNVNDREREMYKNKFSREKSNLSFVVRDQNGETVLSNFLVNDKGLTFTKTIQIYEYDLPYYVEYFGGNEPDTTEMPGRQEYTTTPPEAVENETVPAEEPTAAQTTAAPAEETRAVSPLSGAGATLYSGVTEPQVAVSEHLYLLDVSDDEYEDAGPVRFKYIYYGETYNEDILNYCKQFYNKDHGWYSDFAEMTDNWMIFREDDFGISDNGVVYYKGPAEPTTLVIESYYENAPHTDYNVTYTLPKTMAARDLFYYVEKLAGYAYGYIHKIIPLTVFYALAAVVFFVLLLVCAGHVKGEETPRAKGLHRIPYDIVSAVFFVVIVALSFFIIDDGPYSGPLPIAVAATALALSILLFIETTVVRIKAKTIGSNIFVVRFCRWFCKLIKNAAENKNLFWIVGGAFAVVTVAEFVYSALLYQEDEFIALLFIAKALEIPLVLLAAINLNKVQNGAKRLAEGDLTEKVDMKYLVGPFRKNAEYLNAVNDGVNRAVNERMRSESMKTELITNVSHDLKTPLTSIINYVDLLKGTDVRDEKALEYIDVIDRQSQRLKKLCADIVDASKAATGNLEIHAERTALNVMLGQVIGEYDERLKERSLTRIAAMPEHDVFIHADGRLLWRVFDNLMNNVCKYAMSGTRVYLSLQQQGGSAALVLRNISGAALNISPEELTERFVRGDASRNTEGSGLGLSIAKSITELMGGAFHIAIDGDLFKVTITFPSIN